MDNASWLMAQLVNVRVMLDVLVVALIIYWLLSVAQGTRALHLIRGIVTLFVFLYLLGWLLELNTLNWLIENIWPGLFIAIPVIFQPELRRAFEQIGHTGSWLKSPFPTQDSFGTEVAVDEIVRAAAQLSRLRYGALMVIARETGLQDYVKNGVSLDAAISRQLLINIFFPNSPLHDAAVIIEGDRILAASVVLPLTDNISASSQLGTRHRAAIGVTEESDALAIVVSEETGQMSVAHSGRLIRNLDQDRLRRVLRTLLHLDKPLSSRDRPSGRFNLGTLIHPNGSSSGTSGRVPTRRERDVARNP